MASEVLKVAFKASLTNSESVLINGTNGHTYTILSITFCETAGAAETFDLYMDDDGGGTDYEIYSDQALGANETFEHTGRIVLEDEDHLCAATASSAARMVWKDEMDESFGESLERWDDSGIFSYYSVGDLAAGSRNSHYAPPLTSRAPVSFDHLKTPSFFWEK